MNRFFLAAAVLLTTGAASAASLAGNYLLTRPCEIKGPALDISLSAGPIVVSENIPSRNSTMTFQAILVQSAAQPQSPVVLGIGEVDDFAYGLHPYSLGAYSQDRSSFENDTLLPRQGGGIQLLQTVRLQQTATGLVLSVISGPGSQATCFFGMRR